MVHIPSSPMHCLNSARKSAINSCKDFAYTPLMRWGWKPQKHVKSKYVQGHLSSICLQSHHIGEGDSR